MFDDIIFSRLSHVLFYTFNHRTDRFNSNIIDGVFNIRHAHPILTNPSRRRSY